MIFGRYDYSQKIAKETYQKYSVVVQLFLKETKLGPGIKWKILNQDFSKTYS